MVGVRGLAEAPRSVGTGAGVAGLGVAVGVVPEGAPSESGLDLGLGGVAPQPERPVVVAHGARGESPAEWIEKDKEEEEGDDDDCSVAALLAARSPSAIRFTGPSYRPNYVR
jgi:hypothetical protein